MMTYDQDAKQWAATVSSNLGDYGLEMSAGWSNGKLVWHEIEPPSAGSDESDLIIMKVSASHTTDERTFTTKGVTTVGLRGTCTKSS